MNTDDPESQVSLDAVVTLARRTEDVFQRYRNKGAFNRGHSLIPIGTAESHGSNSSIAFGDTRSEVSNSTMNELLQGIRDLKVSLVNASQSTDSSRNSRSFTCFHCKKEGHRKSDCPELVGTRGQASSTPATGANSVPLNSGKVKGLQV
ncbi:hypothetical protein G6F66_013256 [Rhizopus arrhizus]|nr:hypothetical protein G6F23_012835 [Rhizopus arrhizus]KAG1272955.1 hypothetical protein G6F66_013256 [Rhizopus arrhizus]